MSAAAEIVDAILLALWRMLDAGGISEDRSRRAAILEAITRGRLLPRSSPNNGQAPLEAAGHSTPDSTFFDGCAFDKPPSKLRNREFLAVLLAWLRDYYQQEMDKNPAMRPVGEYVYIKSTLRLLPLPDAVPLLSFEVLIRERTRRRLRKSLRRLRAHATIKTPR